MMDVRWIGRISWEDAYALQEQLVEQRIAGDIGDTVLLLEHEPVITIGRTPDKTSLLEAEQTSVPVIETNRGGQATYHGPGQLVGYLIIDLSLLGRDLHKYLRSLEDMLIRACAAFGVTAQRREGLTGVWVGERKIASLGVGVRKWVTMHGFALNITPESLHGFAPIIPCGIAGVTMTCLSNESAKELTVESVAQVIAQSVGNLGLLSQD